MKLFRNFFYTVCIFTIAIFCCSWGALVHRTTSQLAIYQLRNEPLRLFFFSNKEYFVKNSTRPDDRRKNDSTEATKHFIDLENFGDSAEYKMPMDWATACQLYNKDSLLKYGYVPYEIMRLEDKLTQAFKAKDKDQILFIAADMAHYIEDANVPLHTSNNYDGQLTNQKGIHSLWETMIPEIEIANMNLKAQKKATYLKNPEESIWTAIRRSHDLVAPMFAKEIEVTQQFTDSTKYKVQMRYGKQVKYYTTNFAKAYSQALAPSINDQLINSANLVADFWYTAWKNAGKPDMSGMLTKNFSSTNLPNDFNKERKAYRHNHLLTDSLLIAKKSPPEN